MFGIGPVFIRLDPAALREVGHRLNGVLGDLAALDDLVHRPEADELGGREVADAVAGFVGSWTRERAHLTDHLLACVRYLDEALQRYEETEGVLERTVPQQSVAPEESSP